MSWRGSCVSVSVFRQGDVGTNWYAVLSGSLDMNVSETGDSKVSLLLLLLVPITAPTRSRAISHRQWVRSGSNKKLSCRRGTARCVVSVEILPVATQQCWNYTISSVSNQRSTTLSHPYRVGQKSKLLYCDRYFKGWTIALTLNILYFSERSRTWKSATLILFLWLNILCCTLLWRRVYDGALCV